MGLLSNWNVTVVRVNGHLIGLAFVGSASRNGFLLGLRFKSIGSVVGVLHGWHVPFISGFSLLALERGAGWNRVLMMLVMLLVLLMVMLLCLNLNLGVLNWGWILVDLDSLNERNSSNYWN